MGLLPADVIDAIYGRFVATGLVGRRDGLMALLDPAFVATLEVKGAPNEQLMLDLGALNATTHAVGEFIPLQRWLRSAAMLARAPADAEWFSARATEIRPQAPNRPADTEAQANATIATLKSLAAANTALMRDLTNARTEFEEIAADLKRLVFYKSLHDILHKIQLRRLPIIQDVLRLDKPFGDAASVASIGNAVDELADYFHAARRLLELNPDEADREADWIEELAGIHRALDAAVAARSVVDGLDAVGDLRVLLKNRMSGFNILLAASVRGLRIARLIGYLRDFAAHPEVADDPRIGELRDAATRLSLLKLEIDTLGREHHQWQRIDDKLWLVEENLLFNDETRNALRTFSDHWPSVVASVARIAGETPATWHERLRLHVEAFAGHCTLPAESPITNLAREEFRGFTRGARGQFFTVDDALLSRCSRVGALTKPLDKLAKEL